HGAFAPVVSEVGALVGCHPILVDDVFTTGATMNACAAALFTAGVRTISYLTFGRARGLGDP
ncbi:MAG: ComF family protein, partial [Gemmatimonadota bacterium]